MRPTPLQWLFGSRYTIPLWIGLGLWLWYSQGGDWNALNQDQQISFVIIGAFFALAFLKCFPTTYFYEREQSRYRKSSMSPEERWQRATVSQTLLLLLVAAAALYFGFHYWKSTPEPEPVSFKAAGIGGASVLMTTAYLKVRTWRGSQQAGQPAIVAWCLPVPKQSASQPQLVSQLPDYCQRVLAGGAVRSPAHAPPVQPQVQA